MSNNTPCPETGGRCLSPERTQWSDNPDRMETFCNQCHFKTGNWGVNQRINQEPKSQSILNTPQYNPLQPN